MDAFNLDTWKQQWVALHFWIRARAGRFKPFMNARRGLRSGHNAILARDRAARQVAQEAE
jgi:hypothetical protein